MNFFNLNRDDLNLVLNKQTEKKQRIFKMYYFDKIHYKEISKKENISISRISIIINSIIDYYYLYNRFKNNKTNIYTICFKDNNMDLRLLNFLRKKRIEDLKIFETVKAKCIKGLGKKYLKYIENISKIYNINMIK